MRNRSRDAENESESSGRSNADGGSSSREPGRSRPARRLQRSVGNQAVQSMAENGAFDHRNDGDDAEGEQRTPDPDVPLQRQSGSGTAGGEGVPEVVSEVVSSPGRAMDGTVRRKMEASIGGNLGNVRLHTGSRAATAARAIDAKAFTVGNHVAFDHGEYDPGSGDGMETLAHELVHVRQQTGGGVPQRLGDDTAIEGISDPSDRHEREATRIARQVTDPRTDAGSVPSPSPLNVGTSRVATLQRRDGDSGNGSGGAGSKVSLGGTVKNILDRFTEAFAAVDEQITGGGRLGGILTVLKELPKHFDTRQVYALTHIFKQYTHFDSAAVRRLNTRLAKASGKIARVGAKAAKVANAINLVAVVAALAANYQKAQAKSAIAKIAISLAQEGLMFQFAKLNPAAAAVDAVFAVVPGVKAPIGSTMKASINTIGTMINATVAWANGNLESASKQAKAMHQYLKEEGNVLFQMTQAGGEMLVDDEAAMIGAEGIADVYGEPGATFREYVTEPVDTVSSGVSTAAGYVNPF